MASDLRVRFLGAAASSGMGGRLRAGKLLKHFTKPARPTTPSTLSWTENEYQPNDRPMSLTYNVISDNLS